MATRSRKAGRKQKISAPEGATASQLSWLATRMFAVEAAP